MEGEKKDVWSAFHLSRYLQLGGIHRKLHNCSFVLLASQTRSRNWKKNRGQKKKKYQTQTNWKSTARQKLWSRFCSSSYPLRISYSFPLFLFFLSKKGRSVNHGRYSHPQQPKRTQNQYGLSPTHSATHGKYVFFTKESKQKKKGGHTHKTNIKFQGSAGLWNNSVFVVSIKRAHVLSQSNIYK